MTTRILVVQELKPLLGDAPVPGCEITWFPSRGPVPAGDFRALVPLVATPVGEDLIDALQELKIIANCGVGTDNIDLEAASRHGVLVSNTPDVLTEATADLTWALILAAGRRLKEGLRMVERGQWSGWDPTLLLGMELKGRTLGVIGAGRIGSAVARRAPAFGMRVVYTARTARPELDAALGAARVDLHRLLGESDVVTLHVPLTPETVGLLNRERLQLLKRGSLVINAARGDLLDEEALLEGLEAGRIAGAGLDVFHGEPEVDPRLVAHPRVVTLPHIGSATEDTRRAMAALAVANVRAVLAGQPPLTPVSR